MNGTGHTRRAVLGAAGLGAAGLSAAVLGAAGLAGCGLFGDHPEPTAADPLRALLDEAVALAAAYDRMLIAQPDLSGRLTPLADDHRAHATELARVLGITVPSAAPTAASPDPATAGPGAARTVAGLRKAEQAAQKTASAACLRAPVDRAALTGSIAACRATHAEALR
jgi:hypothetical protein